jgi:hypothetical protein
LYIRFLCILSQEPNVLIYRQKNQTKFSIGTSFFVDENLLFKEDFAKIRKDSVGHCVSELCPGIGRKNPALYREAIYNLTFSVLTSRDLAVLSLYSK